jgi:hypothetical protein
MLSTVRGTQAVGSVPRQGSAPEEDLPTFMLMDAQDESWRNAPLPPPPRMMGSSTAGTEPAQMAINSSETPRQKGKKTTKSSIKLAALNIHGNGSVNINHNDNKWWRLNQIMSHERIGILIVGEAHLDEERLDSINSVYKRQLLVHFSRDRG